ncbi:CLUMA_CG018954, isoform A [Clunio marinus]|uniref:Glycerol kinase 5 n=1 Tax=Clunio marinus TaxID=568069 RepID=A0A1J1J1H7_9DIPT|nr:CLUMA_CG018954, isoform A [Clunio marinus]
MTSIHFAVLDIGTTSVRCYVYNQKFEVISTASREIKILLPQHGHIEIEPEELFKDVVDVIKEAVNSSGVSFENITLGISTQRSTFTTWSKSTGKVFHNFITWKDIRADYIVKQWNNSWKLKGLNFSASMIYSVTRANRFLAGSVLKLMNNQLTPRLLWVINNNQKLNEAVKQQDAVFGTIDSFLLFRLKQGKEFKPFEHISEVTNCTATGLYDPFTLGWSALIAMFNLKLHMFPKVVDNSYNFGDVDKSHFGIPVKIVGIMGDQPASMFGNCCFDDGDAKVTLGTGTFFDINTSKKCHASILGFYPLVSWILRDGEANYSVEGSSYDTATIINWGKSIGLFNDPKETSDMAESVEDSQNVFFIPAFSGLTAPVNDFRAAAGFIGISADTTRHHLVRALLESIVFRVAQLLKASMKETEYKIRRLRVDGGVSNNDFICQTLSDICDITVERSSDTENTSLGIAFLCAYNLKFATIDELKKCYKPGKTFTPRLASQAKLVATMERWEEAIERFKHWY